MYESGPINGSILKETSTIDITGPYDVTNSTMTWTSDTDYNQRKAVSGEYTCHGNNKHGDVDTQAMTLTVECKCVYSNSGIFWEMGH